MFAGSRSFLTIALFLFAIPALAQPTASPAPSAEAPPTAEPATGEPLAAKPTMAEPKPAESVPAQPSPVPAIKAEQDLVLDEVVVSAARIGVPVKENPSAASVVTEKESGYSSSRSIGAEEALRLVPGVKVDNQADGERVHLSPFAARACSPSAVCAESRFCSTEFRSTIQVVLPPTCLTSIGRMSSASRLSVGQLQPSTAAVRLVVSSTLRPRTVAGD
jgi:hypothetical protein